jgi:phosphopantetheinyl transferase
MTRPDTCQVKYSGRNEWLCEEAVPLSQWLSAAEVGELNRLRDARRRQQWLQGRWVSKQLICETLGANLTDVQILTRDDQHRGVRPQIFMKAQNLDWSLSISHSDTGVLVALFANNEFAVGVDLASNVPCNRGFHELWFTPRERRWLQEDTQRRTTLLWALKEAVYKACNRGESWAPSAIETLPKADGSFQCTFWGVLLDGLCVDVWDIDGQTAVVACTPRHADLAHMNASADIRHIVAEPIEGCSASPWTDRTSEHSLKREALALCS